MRHRTPKACGENELRNLGNIRNETGPTMRSGVFSEAGRLPCQRRSCFVWLRRSGIRRPRSFIVDHCVRHTTGCGNGSWHCTRSRREATRRRWRRRTAIARPCSTGQDCGRATALRAAHGRRAPDRQSSNACRCIDSGWPVQNRSRMPQRCRR